LAVHKDYSEETAERIDEEITRIVRTSYERAKKLLQEHVDILHELAMVLWRKRY